MRTWFERLNVIQNLLEYYQTNEILFYIGYLVRFIKIVSMIGLHFTHSMPRFVNKLWTQRVNFHLYQYLGDEMSHHSQIYNHCFEGVRNNLSAAGIIDPG